VLCPFFSPFIDFSHGIHDVSCHSQRYYYKFYWEDNLTPVGNPRGFFVDLTTPDDQVGDFIVAVYSADQEQLIGVSVTRLEVVFLLTLFYFMLLTPWLLWCSPLIFVFL
jgi:hypothetical protein